MPNHHFQWIVMSSSLKTTPLLFQKAMIPIFQFILHSALIYIDDILLFSSIFEKHLPDIEFKFLYQFANIVKNFGVMLFEKKTILAQKDINFLGMKISDGSCTPE